MSERGGEGGETDRQRDRQGHGEGQSSQVCHGCLRGGRRVRAKVLCYVGVVSRCPGLCLLDYQEQGDIPSVLDQTEKEVWKEEEAEHLGGGVSAASTWQRQAGRGLDRCGGRWWLVSAGPGKTDQSQCWRVCLQPPSSARTYPEKDGWSSSV